jgi:diguanylate cyclase (GGDEF)-like protein
VAEKIRTAVEELRPRPSGTRETVNVTVSVGGASLDGKEINVDRLIGSADQALYEAKRRGRNQVVLWTPEANLPDRARATHHTDVTSHD